MTPDERRQAWLENAIDEQSEGRIAENLASYTVTRPQQYATKEEEHAFACGWDLAVEMVKKELAALLDGMRCEEPVPDYPAMAQAVWEAVQKERKLTQILADEKSRCFLERTETAENERDALRADLQVAHDIGDSFWAAIKPLNLHAINVTNPGTHVTEVIRERDGLRAEVWQLRALLLALHPAAHGHEDWLHCAVCAALAPSAAPTER